MTELIGNATELIQQGGEFLKQPAVSSLFAGLKKWVGGLLTRNKATKQKLAEAQDAKDQLTVLQENLQLAEEWNNELQAELEAKEKEIDDFARQAGINLSGSTNTNSIVGNTIGNVGGNMVAGSGNTLSNAPKLDTDKLIGAIKSLKIGVSADVVANLSGLDKNLLIKIEQAIK